MKQLTTFLLIAVSICPIVLSSEFPDIQAADVVDGQANTALRYEMTVSGGGPIRVTATDLPEGLSLLECVISGVPALPGDTLVIVSATNEAGVSQKAILFRIAEGAGPQAPRTPSVSSNPALIQAGVPAIFDSNATGLADFIWNFGDGSISTAAHPSHTYSQAGSYLVTLTATVANTTRIVSSDFAVSVAEQVPGAQTAAKTPPQTFPITLSVIKAKSAAPFSSLVLGATPLDPTLSTQVIFAAKTYSYTATVLSAQITSTGLKVSVPPYYSKGKFGAGSVTAQIVQASSTKSNPQKLKIGGLPKAKSVGAASLSFVDAATAMLADLKANVKGGIYDTSTFQSSAAQQATILNNLHASIQSMMGSKTSKSKAKSFSIGSINGADLQVDAKNLAVCDSLVAAIVSAAGTSSSDTEVAVAAKAWAAAMIAGKGDVAVAAAGFTTAYHNLVQVQTSKRVYADWQQAEFSLLPFSSALDSLSLLLGNTGLASRSIAKTPPVGSAPGGALALAGLASINASFGANEKRVGFEELQKGNVHFDDFIADYILQPHPTTGSISGGNLQSLAQLLSTLLAYFANTTQDSTNILPPLTVSHQSILVGAYDHGTVDGDILTMSINGNPVSGFSPLTLPGPPGPMVSIKLDPGDNVLTIKALNEGQYPPNTATVLVDGTEYIYDLPTGGGAVIKISNSDKLISATKVAAPDGTDNSRALIGVCEAVTITATEAVTWTVTGGGSLSSANGTTTVFTAPDIAANCKVTATYTNKSTNYITYGVIPPSGQTYTKLQNRNVYPVGQAGAGMYLSVKLTPLNVCFGGIDWKEIGLDPINVTGYFVGKAGHHNPNPDFLPVGNDNFVQGTDDASSGVGARPQPWSNGSYTWPIPNNYIRRGAAGNGYKFVDTTQTFTIAADGTCGVIKGTASCSRNPNTGYAP